ILVDHHLVDGFTAPFALEVHRFHHPHSPARPNAASRRCIIEIGHLEQAKSTGPILPPAGGTALYKLCYGCTMDECGTPTGCPQGRRLHSCPNTSPTTD